MKCVKCGSERGFEMRARQADGSASIRCSVCHTLHNEDGTLSEPAEEGPSITIADLRLAHANMWGRIRACRDTLEEAKDSFDGVRQSLADLSDYQVELMTLAKQIFNDLEVKITEVEERERKLK